MSENRAKALQDIHSGVSVYNPLSSPIHMIRKPYSVFLPPLLYVLRYVPPK